MGNDHTTVCLECHREAAEAGGEDRPPRWHFKTVDQPCARCGSSYSHRRVMER